MFNHVYSEPHPLIEEQLAWLENYEGSFEDEGHLSSHTSSIQIVETADVIQVNNEGGAA
jgi:hypothetical protein